MASPAHPPKVGTTDPLFAAALAAAQAAEDVTEGLAKQVVVGPWRAYATAVGQSAPANINATLRSIRAIRRSTR